MCCEDPIGRGGGQGGGLDRAALSKATPPPPSRHLSHAQGACIVPTDTLRSARTAVCLSLPLLVSRFIPTRPSFTLTPPSHSFHLFSLAVCTFSPSGGHKGRVLLEGEGLWNLWPRTKNYCSGWERPGCRGATKFVGRRRRRRSRSAERQSRETQKACFQGTDHAGLRGAAAVPGGAPHGRRCQKNQEKRAQSQGEAARFEG